MHGLEKIKELNELAVQNDPKFIKEHLDQAAIEHAGEPKLTNALKEAQQKRIADREEAISKLEKETLEQLTERLASLQYPSILEEALCRKLQKYLADWSKSVEYTLDQEHLG